VTSALDSLPPVSYPHPIHNHPVAYLAELRPKIEAAALNATSQPLAAVELTSGHYVHQPGLSLGPG
jgi:hypothetical protein